MTKKRYTDFRKLLERKDIDVVAIATPPHWHALISIAAAEAGKDVLCEKPMTRTIAEGRAVVDAFKRYGRIFQVGTFGRFGVSRQPFNILIHKMMRSGLYKDQCPAVHVMHGGVKVKEWSGRINIEPRPVPPNLDWDLYCGPSPLKPFHPPRHGGTHRWFWDYEGGGLCDMGQHHFDPIIWLYGKDDTAPVEIEPNAAVAHPECSGMWSWVKLKYADGFQIVMESREWGPCKDCSDSVLAVPDPAKKGQNLWKCRGCGKIVPDVPSSDVKARQPKLEDFSPADQAKIKAMPDPEPLRNFAQAVKSRKCSGGSMPEAALRTVTVIHLANLAIRLGRKLRFDPATEQIVGDPEANRMINQPMRAPFHL
jgi:predicted dehydrogenase